ncbi:MAG: YbhB/YbcL family Raf kinase inhibitor-like protein, partial [Acidimicrobiia bacterium]
LTTSCTDSGATTATETTRSIGGTMQISSPAFDGSMPSRFTCDGFDVSPPLSISGVPSTAASLVLIVDDPDAPDPSAPKMVWDHWVVWGIDPGVRDVPEGTVPQGGVQGRNSWGRNDYGGPCPPTGTHRYFFKVYALDVALNMSSDSTKKTVEMAMQEHIIDEAEMIGTYHR